jgi:hypothetical protein
MPDSLPVEHLLTLTVAIEPAAMVTGAPDGDRIIIRVLGGRFTGPRLTGTVQTVGGDWVARRVDGSARLDARLLLTTDDGAHILMHYRGITTEGGQLIRAAPLFETGAADYSWLNTVQGVATGRTGDRSVTYEVYALR